MEPFMTLLNSKIESHDIDLPNSSEASSSEKPRWETPQMEDVSEQVMAQPYIRFT
jgi:hypothetical protein